MSEISILHIRITQIIIFYSHNETFCLVNRCVYVVVRDCLCILEFIADFLFILVCQEWLELSTHKRILIFNNISEQNKAKLTHHDIGLF